MMAGLEEELGVKLLHRTTRRVAVTEQGERIYHWAQRILDAFFESISGFTTTGETVLPSIEVLPQSILFWRSMTQWFGGLGIIVIFIALLPQAGQSTVHMYNAESSGHERVMPRLREMTGALFRIYTALTVLCAVILWLCGML